MIFKKFIINNFKRIKEKTLDFVPAINIVKGPNEIGKSTIRLAFLRLLFTKTTATGKEIQMLLPWGLDVFPKLSLTFEINGVQGELIKDFDKKSSILSYQGKKSEDMNRVQTKISELLGINSEKLFEATAYIDHASVTEITSGHKEIKESLSATFTGSGEAVDAQKILNKLKEQIESSERGLSRPVASPGKIKLLSDEVSELKKQFLGQTKKAEDLEKYSKNLDEINKDLKGKKKSYEEKKRLFDLNTEKLERETGLQSFRNQYININEQFEKDNKNRIKLEGIEQELGKIKLCDNLEEIKNAIGNYESSKAIKLIIQENGKAIKILKGRKMAIEWCALLFGSIIFVIGTFIINRNIWFALLILFGVGLFLYGVLKLVDFRSRYNQLEKENNENQGKVVDLDRDIKSFLDKYIISSIDELKMLSEKRASLLGEKGAIEGLIDNNFSKKIEEEKREIGIKMASLEAELNKPEYKVTALSQQEYVRLKMEIDELEKNTRELERKQLEIKGAISTIEVNEEQISALIEEIEEKENQLLYEKRRLEILKVINETLKEAYQSTLIPAKAVLKEKVVEYFSLITGNRYSQIEMDENTLEFKLFSPEKNDWVVVEAQDKELSRGTIDQFFLSVRLALVDIISRERKPPIFLDDPFITFDNERLRKTMLMLKEIAKEHQIIIFTCKDVYDEFADNVIKVPQ